jgi:hypothetical protein
VSIPATISTGPLLCIFHAEHFEMKGWTSPQYSHTA